MNHDKLLDIVKGGNITIPLYIYKMFDKLNIDYETFIFLMYLYGKGNKLLLDVKSMSEELGLDGKKIMNYISSLEKNKIIEIKVIKNDKDIMEEYLFLDLLYNKISINIVNEEVKQENIKENNDIFELLEKEVGIQLTFTEIEIVKLWNYDKEVIKEAIKEAIKNNVASVRYIDKVLYSWSKKGIKTKEDVEKNRKNYKSKDDKVDVFEYNWLDDDE
jgi:DNA replication protein